jgi:hypothetical protein
LLAALTSVTVRERFTAKLVDVPGSGCLWWTGAVSGKGHGRFWIGQDRVIVAHRYAFGLVHGVEALLAVETLAHGCDNPLCQRAAEGHVVASTAALNRSEWAQRRRVIGSPLTDPRGALRRARSLRDFARISPLAVTAELERLRGEGGEQLAMW